MDDAIFDIYGNPTGEFYSDYGASGNNGTSSGGFGLGNFLDSAIRGAPNIISSLRGQPKPKAQATSLGGLGPILLIAGGVLVLLLVVGLVSRK